MNHIFKLLFICFPIFVFSQKDYVEDVIPEIGDEFPFSIDYNFDNIDIKEDYTGKLEWDFTSLKSDESSVFKVSSIEESSNNGLFDDADFFVKIGDSEEFYKIIDSNKRHISKMVIQLGLIGESIYSLGLNVISRIEGKNIHQFSKIKYNDSFNDADYSFEYINDTSFLPDSIKSKFDVYGIDSIKVISNLDGSFYVNGYGTLKIPSGKFDVVRVESVTDVETSLFARSESLGGWFSVPQEYLPEDFASVFGKRTLKQHLFYADDYHWPVANVYTLQKNFGPYQNDKVVYYNPSMISSTNDKTNEIVSVVEAYPNPTFGMVVFKRSNTLEDQKINIYNVIGKKLNSYKFKQGKDSLEVNLSHLQKGTYVYSLVDDNGRRLTSKRLIILNP